MRLEATEKSGEYKVQLTDSENEDLRRATTGYRDGLIIQLGAFVGLRSSEIPQVQPRHIKTIESGQYRLRVPEGKDTTGSGGKPRDTYLLDDIGRSLQQFANTQGMSDKSTERSLRADPEAVHLADLFPSVVHTHSWSSHPS